MYCASSILRRPASQRRIDLAVHVIPAEIKHQSALSCTPDCSRGKLQPAHINVALSNYGASTYSTLLLQRCGSQVNKSGKRILCVRSGFPRLIAVRLLHCTTLPAVLYCIAALHACPPKPPVMIQTPLCPAYSKLVG